MKRIFIAKKHLVLFPIIHWFYSCLQSSGLLHAKNVHTNKTSKPIFHNIKRIFNRKTFGGISPIIHWSFNWSLISDGTFLSYDEFSHNPLNMKLLFNIRFADFELWREHIQQRYPCSTIHRELSIGKKKNIDHLIEV